MPRKHVKMQLRALLTLLVDQQIRFSVIGGVALIARGVQRSTQDLDIAYARDRKNLARLAAALQPLHPKLRGVPGDLPFVLDEALLRSGLNFTLDTDLGPLDLLGEVPGLGTFDQVDAMSSELDIGGTQVTVLTVQGLVRSKRAAGRPKDLVDLGYLHSLEA